MPRETWPTPMAPVGGCSYQWPCWRLGRAGPGTWRWSCNLLCGPIPGIGQEPHTQPYLLSDCSSDTWSGKIASSPLFSVSLSSEVW